MCAMVSADVSAGDDILATDHNNMRADLITNHGHINTGGEGATHLRPAQVTITPGGAVIAQTITQAHDNISLYINSEATGLAGAITVTGKYCARLVQDLSSGYGLEVSRNINEAGNRPLVRFLEDHASGTQTVLEIDNDGSGSNILFTHAVTRYVKLDASAFKSTAEDPSDDAAAGWSIRSSADQSAEVRIPAGAIITRFDFWAYGTNLAGVQTITADFRRNDLDANVEDDIAQVSLAWGDGEAASFKTGNDVTIGNGTEDDGFSYYIFITTTAFSLRIKGAKVSYTIVEPLP
jgi:hypothetical protein